MDSSAKVILVENGAGRRKKRKVDWICVNPNCTKSKAGNVITAKPFVVSYFGSKLDDYRKRKVCEDCYVQANVSLNKISEKITQKEPFFGEPLPILCNDAVVLDDSDEDDKAKTDDSDESEVEFELHDEETIEKLVANTIQQLGIPQQIDWGIENVSQR